MKRAIVTLTSAGAEFGLKLKNEIPGAVLYSMPGRCADSSVAINGTLKKFTASIFNLYDTIVFIMAAGIVVRIISGLLRDKTSDPGVLVIDEKGRFVISLLSGHIGGANMEAEYVASLIGAVPVVTTSSDINGMLSPDMLAVKYGCVIDDMKICKDITSLMVNGGKIALSTEYDVDPVYPYILNADDADGIVYITNRTAGEGFNCMGSVNSVEKKTDGTGIPSLRLIPENVVIGAGCRRGTDPEIMKKFIEEELEMLGVDTRSVSALASINIKRDEPALKSAAEYFNAELKFYTAEEIGGVEHLFQCSDFVRETTGAGCVSEPSAYLASGGSGKLLLPKKKKDGVTIAVMEKPLRELF